MTNTTISLWFGGKIIILDDFFDDGYLVEQEANEVSVNNFMGRNILMKAIKLLSF